MHLFQLLANGTVWVYSTTSDRYFGPFANYADGFEWAEANRAPGAQIRNKGLLRVMPEDWTDPNALPQGDEETTREGQPEDIGELVEDIVAEISDEEKADAVRVRPELIEEVGALSVPKMSKRLGELNAAELDVLLQSEERGSARRAISKAIEALG